MKKHIKVISAMFVLAVLIAVLTGCSGGKIDPAEYLSEPEFSGCNGYGKVYVAFDEEALITELIGEEPASMSDTGIEWLMLYESYSENITCEYTRENLSNGDTLVVKITATGDATEKVKNAEVKFTVEGLPEVEYADIFEDVELQFSGISGNAMAKLTLTGSNDVLNACKFNIEPNYGLKNGDVVTVTVANTESILNKFYTLPETESKTFTVSGLEYYATAEDLPMDTVNEIATQIVAEEQAENDSDPNFTYTDVELYGVFFMTGKEDAWADENQLHFVIHYDMLEDDGSVRFSYYIPLYITDILAAADGTVTISREDCVSLFFRSITIRTGASTGWAVSPPPGRCMPLWGRTGTEKPWASSPMPGMERPIPSARKMWWASVGLWICTTMSTTPSGC